MTTEVFIPKFGQTVEEVILVKWLVSDGAKIAHGQEILEVETDKAIFTVESGGKGWLHIGPFKEGDTVPVLTVVATIGKEEEIFLAPGIEPAKFGNQDSEEKVSIQSSPHPLTSQEMVQSEVFVSPRARKLAREKNVDLTRVTPTGGEGVRVVEKDILKFIAHTPKATPLAERIALVEGVDLRSVNGSGLSGKITQDDVARKIQLTDSKDQGSPSVNATSQDVIERIPLKGVRAIIADRMATSVHTTARVTMIMEVDATDLVLMRQRLRAKVEQTWGFTPGYNDILAIIVSKALRKYPYMNARLAQDAIELMGHVNIGIAVDTDRGLLVPVVRDVDQLNIHNYGATFRQLVERIRNNRSLPEDLSGGTFTITNLGMYDVDAFTPVINLPECAILGVGRIAPKAVVFNNEIVIRHRLTLSLVFDHRLVDGAPAARFLQYIKELVEEPYLILADWE